MGLCGHVLTFRAVAPALVDAVCSAGPREVVLSLVLHAEPLDHVATTCLPLEPEGWGGVSIRKAVVQAARQEVLALRAALCRLRKSEFSARKRIGWAIKGKHWLHIPSEFRSCVKVEVAVLAFCERMWLVWNNVKGDTGLCLWYQPGSSEEAKNKSVKHKSFFFSFFRSSMGYWHVQITLYKEEAR